MIDKKELKQDLRRHQMQMFRCFHRDGRYTLRIPATGFEAALQRNVIRSVQSALSDAFDCLDLPGHLFVTIVNGDSIATDEGHGWALYMSGIASIVVAGLKPEAIEQSDFEFLAEVEKSVIHECVHYWQDMERRLIGSSENEDEAELITGQIVSGEILIDKLLDRMTDPVVN